MGWMGPVVDGQEHEGWVVPLFADGAQGAGTSSADKRLIARLADDGPCGGDRVRLTYRDGSTAEGLWQDGTLIRGGFAGASWADIGWATGMTGRSATERWSRP